MDEHDDGGLNFAARFCAEGLRRNPTREHATESPADEFVARASVGKLAFILARLATLWSLQARERQVSRLDGEVFFTDAEWSALGESALFAKLRRARDDGGDSGGGAPAHAENLRAPRPPRPSSLDARPQERP